MQAAIAMQLGDLTAVEDDPTPPRGDEPPAYNCYQCSDGVFINIAAILPHQFARLCEVLDLPHLARDDRLTDPRRRAELHREANPLIHALLATRAAQEWLDLMNGADVPCAPIVDRTQVPYEEQVIANEMMVPLQHPLWGPPGFWACPSDCPRRQACPFARRRCWASTRMQSCGRWAIPLSALRSSAKLR